MNVVDQEYRLVPLADLEKFPGNPRRGKLDSIAQSVNANGFYGAVIVQKSTNRILAGNHRYLTALAADADHIPAIVVDVDDTTAKRILAADNRTAELASWDNQQLVDLLEELASEDAAQLLGSGFDADDLIGLQLQIAAERAGEIDYSKEWDESGMPDYESNDISSAYRTVVHFRTEADADRFFAEMQRPKKKVWWWPESDGHVVRLSKSRVRAEADA